MARHDMSWRDKAWSKFLDDLSIKNYEKNHKNKVKMDVETSAARLSVEKSIILRIRHLMGDAIKVEKSSNKFWVETSNVIDSDLIADTYLETVHDLPKIRQVFWSFIENSINNNPNYTADYNKIFDFFSHLLEDFNSDDERTGFIDSFYFSLFGKYRVFDEFHISIERDSNYSVFREGEIIPPRIRDREDEIEMLKKEKDIQTLFYLFQLCMVSYGLHGNIELERINFFESVTDVEKRLFELLYVDCPRNMEDARGWIFGDFDAIDAMKNDEWERFDTKTREEIIKCLDEMCQGEKPIIYKYLAPEVYKDTLDCLSVTPYYVLVEKVKNIKFKLTWPVYYRLQKNINDISRLLLTNCEFADKVFGADVIDDFQKDLNSLIKSKFENFV